MSILTRDANSLGFRHIFLLLLSKSVWRKLDVQNIADYLSQPSVVILNETTASMEQT